MNKLVGIALIVTIFTPALAAPKTEDDVRVANEAAFRAALATKKLSTVALERKLAENTSLGTTTPPSPGMIDLVITDGYHAEERLFVANAKHEVFRVRRAPKVTKTITQQLGCRGSIMAGGRAWTTHEQYALPKGFTYKGEITVAYDTTAWVGVDAKTKPDGTPCPPPSMMLD